MHKTIEGKNFGTHKSEQTRSLKVPATPMERSRETLLEATKTETPIEGGPSSGLSLRMPV